MRPITLAACGLSAAIFLAAPGPARARQNIVAFYHKADSISAHPSRIGEYEVKKSRKIERYYVSFIGKKGSRRILIAAVTPKPIKDIRKELALSLQFDGGRPGLGPTTTWGYVFDRNGDGRIDYLALVAAAIAVEDDSIPFDFPGYSMQMDKKQFGVYISHLRIVFNHWADDNFDGKIDATVQVDMDPFRNWVKRSLLLRSTKFNGVFDDARAFRDRIGNALGTVERTAEGVTYYPIGEPRGVPFKREAMDEGTKFLSLFNRAAQACRLTAADF